MVAQGECRRPRSEATPTSLSCPFFAQRNQQRLRLPPPPGKRIGHLKCQVASQTATPSETSAEVPEPARHRVAVSDSPEGLKFYFRAGRNLFRLRSVWLSRRVAGRFSMPCFACRSGHRSLLGYRRPADFLLDPGFHPYRLHFHSHRRGKRRDLLAPLRSGNRPHPPNADCRRGLDPGRHQHSARRVPPAARCILCACKPKPARTTPWSTKSRAARKRSGSSAEIEKRAGLQLNTQVQINDGLYGLPPQPGAASSERPCALKKILRPHRALIC